MSTPYECAAEAPTTQVDGDRGPIAIVGIGCRYADARGPEEFWEIVRSGRNTVRDAPEHRIDLGYDIDHFYDPRPRIPGKISSKKGGFLEHPELFDPVPFGIAPRDALTMDPQQRILVEVTWDALEDAGIVPESLVGERVSVILGYMAEDYSRERTGVLGEEAVFRGHDVFTVGGMSHAVLSGRIAYLLGVTGPSFTLDTACSSSLIATHLACQSLRRGESKMAIAGGANLFLSPEGNIALSRSGMLSMSGACKAFDANADGFVRAEGAGVVVLRPLADALEDGNPIYAVIRGSGISTDGRDGGHMMAPGRTGQAQAMRDAYAQAGVAPSDIQYVETHGTGTMIGDPVEIGALADVMGPGRDPDRPLRVASVKGNLGHTESASGVAGLINAVLAIRHRRLPRQLHFETPNPVIPWDEIPIRVQKDSEPWPEDGPALVGVNSFGISGTNAHLVLESAPASSSHSSVPGAMRGRVGSDRENAPRLITITGHDSKSLHEMAELHRATPTANGALDPSAFDDLAYTLGLRRSHRPHRLTVVANSLEEMRRELGAYLDGNPFSKARTGVANRDPSSKLVMVFPGQGGQWLGMGRGLLGAEPVFSESIDRIDAAYQAQVQWSLRSALLGESGFDWSERLDVLQPVLVAVEIALSELWASWGIRPDRVIGQSMGEIAAAYVAGALGLEDMARLACQRGKVVARASGRGAMAVVSVSPADLEETLVSWAGRAEIAGSNSPSSTILSGDRDAVTALVEHFEAREVFARVLDVDFASHCFHMDPLLDDFRSAIGGIEARPTTIPFDSTADGEEKSGPELGTDYWVRNLRAAVAFDRGVSSSLAAGARDFLEVSPHPAMSRAISETAAEAGETVGYFSSLERDQNEQRTLLASAGALFTGGFEIDFMAILPEGRVARTPLYAYQRKRFWFSERNRLHRARPAHPLLGERSQSSVDPKLYSWDFLLDADSGGFVADFAFDGIGGAPSGLYPELALAAAESIWPGHPGTIEAFEFAGPLLFGESGRRRVQVTLRLEDPSRGELRVSSRDEGSDLWRLHALCTIARPDAPNRSGESPPLLRSENATRPVAEVFAGLEACGIELGSKCRTLRELEVEANPAGGEPNCLARFMLPRVSESEWHAYSAHPAILENCIQLIGDLFEQPVGVRPLAIGRFRMERGLGSDCWCRIRRHPIDPSRSVSAQILEADVEFFDGEGEPIGSIESIQVEALTARATAGAPRRSDLAKLEWKALEPEIENPSRAKLEKTVERWVLISDSAVEASAFAAELEKEGGTSHFCEKVEDLPRLAAQMERDSHRSWGLLLLAWRNGAADAEPEADRQFRVGSWAAAIRDHCDTAQQVWIATSGLQRVAPRDPEIAPLAPIIAKEIETFASCVDLQRCRLFDAGARVEHAERLALASLVGSESDERQYVAREKELFVPRLVESGGAERSSVSLGRPAAARNFRAVHRGAEGADCLALEEVCDPDGIEGSVVVAVRSAALSQLDVLTGLGLARGPVTGPRSVAMDFSGVVLAVGDAHGDYRVGDEVVGVSAGALARRIVVPTSSVVQKPAGFDFHEAACLPLPYLAAQYSLKVVARLRAGERVLVKSAGGGMGQAMVAVARKLGAEVTATASTKLRREALQALGARVLDEWPGRDRGDDFDLIVTAESGAPFHDSLARLAPGGRALDLCPRNGFVRPEIGSLRLAANRSVSSIDIVAMMEDQPSLIFGLLDGLPKAATEGHLPLTAPAVFPLSEAGRALRFMAQNRHVGRVCVDLSAAEDAIVEVRPVAPVSIDGAGPFVVSGADRDVLDAIANRLREEGARRVIVTDSARLTDVLKGLVKERLGGWIHLTTGSTRGVEETLRMAPALVRADVDLRLLVSTREAFSGDPAADRSWETRSWIDRLLLPEAEGEGANSQLSLAADTAPDRIADRVAAVVLGRCADGCLVSLSDRDRRQRGVEAPAPFFQDLEARDEGGVSSTFELSALIEKSPPERRAALQDLVCGTLAGVLALSDEQREAIDLGSRIDELGLDSLMTLEVFLGLGRDLELEIELNWFETIPTLAEIAVVLLDRLAARESEAS